MNTRSKIKTRVERSKNEKKKHKIRKIYPDLTPGLDALALALALLLRLTFAAPVVEMCGKLEGHG